MPKLPKYCTFVKSELDFLRSECNFTDMELEYFNLRAKDKTNVEIQFSLHLTDNQVNYLAKRVKAKIMKVINRL